MRRQDSQRGQIPCSKSYSQLVAGLEAHILYLIVNSNILFSSSISTLLPNYVIIYSAYTLVLILRHVSCLYKLICFVFIIWFIKNLVFIQSDQSLKSNSAKRPKAKHQSSQKQPLFFLIVFNSIILKKMFMLLCLPLSPCYIFTIQAPTLEQDCLGSKFHSVISYMYIGEVTESVYLSFCIC